MVRIQLWVATKQFPILDWIDNSAEYIFGGKWIQFKLNHFLIWIKIKVEQWKSHHTLQKKAKATNYNQNALAVQRKLGRNMHDSKDKCDPKICKNGWDGEEPRNFNGDVGM